MILFNFVILWVGTSNVSLRDIETIHLVSLKVIKDRKAYKAKTSLPFVVPVRSVSLFLYHPSLSISSFLRFRGKMAAIKPIVAVLVFFIADIKGWPNDWDEKHGFECPRGMTSSGERKIGRGVRAK